MDLDRAHMLQNYFFPTPIPASKMDYDSTTRNAPYVHPRLDSILKLCRTFPIG